jgi:RND family efflux transporter MFP subunit
MRKVAIAVLAAAVVAAVYVAGSWQGRRAARDEGKPAKKILYWVDPMNPMNRSDRPGKAPCGMDMEPVYADEAGAPAARLAPGTVNVGPEKQQMIGLRVGDVRKSPGAFTLRASGRVAADENRVYTINATVDGWITDVKPFTRGSLVRKNATLATFYSPEFLSAGQAYLFALRQSDLVSPGPNQTPGMASQHEQFKINLKQYRDSLKNLGMSDLQIDEMGRTRQYQENVWILSPVDGFVLSRNASRGQRFDKGTELYRIADLSHVWVLADLFESEARILKPGTAVRFSIPRQGGSYTGKVSDVLPQFDPASRTFKVRLEADNPGFALRPDMFLDVEVPIHLPAATAVPADAIIDSGTRKTVFVDRGGGTFEPRMVETGWRHGGMVEVTKGLKEGERIVLAANFLIASVSKLKAAAAGIYGVTSVDPVCGMDVDEGRARAAGRTADHGGKTYFFCADQCREAFRKEPANYMKGAGPTARKEMPKSAPAVHGGPVKGDAPAEGNPPKQAAEESDELPIDPVCGMVVPPPEAKAAGRVSVYKGKTYYFCADGCKRRFDENPEAYLSKPGKSGMGSGQEGHGEHGKDAHGGHGK